MLLRVMKIITTVSVDDSGGGDAATESDDCVDGEDTASTQHDAGDKRRGRCLRW